jgi:ubiquinone/menaquinone biosynthesis C-methylase UbiE
MTIYDKEIQEIVVREFSNANVQNAYEEMTREGLWASEEKLLKKYFKKNSRILDIGCGSGRTTFDLARLGYNVVGIDLTPAMIKTAKKLSEEFNINIDFKVGNAIKLNFDDKSFDNALFSFNGWDQIPMARNRLLALKETRRVLKPGGYFIFTSHLMSIDKYFFSWIKEWIKFYILKNIGFKIKEIEFGDKFFRRGSKEVYENEQFLHIPKFSKVKAQVKSAGFEIVFCDRRNSIAMEDKKLKSENCMMFVCKRK